MVFPNNPEGRPCPGATEAGKKNTQCFPPAYPGEGGIQPARRFNPEHTGKMRTWDA